MRQTTIHTVSSIYIIPIDGILKRTEMRTLMGLLIVELIGYIEDLKSSDLSRAQIFKLAVH